MCTGIRMTADNKDVVYARTLEFDVPVPMWLGYVPRGMDFQGTTPTGVNGLKWTTKYAVGGQVGAGNRPGMGDFFSCVDGMNEHGLVAGIFNLPGYTTFADVDATTQDKALAIWEAPLFVLSNYKSVDEVKAGIAAGDFIVAATEFAFTAKAKGILPNHMRVGDATGATIVVEFSNGNEPPNVFDAPTGVCCNSPSYPFHQEHILLYDNLTPYNPAGPFSPTSQEYKNTMGQGYVGMPGGSGSMDRFVRAYLYSRDAHAGATGEDAVWAALHTMNNFDIPPGIQRNVSAVDKSESSEFTLYIVIADTANCVYYMRTHANNEVFKLDVKAQDPNGTKVLQDNSPEQPKRAVTEVSFA